MTYFTKFSINTTRRETRSMLSSPYKLHAAIEGSFPAGHSNDGANARTLWRIDRQGNGSMLLYIVSSSKPSLVGLSEQIGFPDLDEPHWVTREYDPFLDRIKEGQAYSFRLVANPVVKKSPAQGVARKLIPHLTVRQQAAWLAGKGVYTETGIEPPKLFAGQNESRAERNGFAIAREESGEMSLVVSDSRKVSFKRRDGEPPVTISVAQYDGVLEVVNPAKLRHALVHGIGHAKAFGCGLLTLVPHGESL